MEDPIIETGPEAPVEEPVESTPAAEPVAAPTESLYEFSEPRDVPEPAPTSTPEPETVPDPAPVEEPGLLADEELPAVGPQTPTVESLQQEVERLRQLVQPNPQQPPAAQPQTPATPAAPEPEVFVTEEQHEELLADPAKFNEFMRTFKRNTQVETIQAAQTFMTPQFMQAAAQQAFEIVEHALTVKDFYANNPELVQYPTEAQKVYEALNAKFPDYTPQQLMAATAKETKRLLGKAGVLTRQPGSAVRPSVPVTAPPTGVRPAVPGGQRPTGLKAEIAEFLGH